MFVHAHPDDEASKGAGTMARYAAQGYRISVVTCTDGGKGDILNPAMDRPGVRERLVEIRRAEMGRALDALGVREHYWLGYPDSGYVEEFKGDGASLDPYCFYNAPDDEAAERLTRILRATRPDVLVTYPPDGGYPHPDHLKVHTASVAAFHAAPDPACYPDAGEPWRPRKLYYTGAFTLARVEALHAAVLARGLESPYAEWLERWDRTAPDPNTTRVEVGAYLAHRTRALLAHATQIDPEGFWFHVPDDVLRDTYPWEDYQLALSLVETALPETSLFAGLE